MRKLIIALLLFSLHTFALENTKVVKIEPKRANKDKQITNNEDRIRHIVNQYLSEALKEPQFSAISGAIYVGGTGYQFHFGKLISGKVPNNQTLYEVGSITKTYTGLLLSQAVYDHKLNLDVDIRLYMDGEYPNLTLNDGQPITLRHLITHTSGLPMNINCSELTVEEQLLCFKSFTQKDFFEQLKKVTLNDKSGNHYHYSNAGVQLVGYIIEKAYRSSFETLLKKFIFSRSGEKDTYVKTGQNLSNRLVIGKNSKGEIMPLEDDGYKYAGGLKSSTESMLKYMKMYLKSEDPVIIQSMNLLAGDEKYGRAYAWNTFEFNQPDKMIYHNGGTFGESSWMAMYPNKKAGIFLVTNVMTKDSQRMLNELSNSIIAQIFKN